MQEIILRKDDCYCSLLDLYNKVASRAGYEITREIKYDCRKILITKEVQKEIMDFYTTENHVNTLQIYSLLLLYGPKAIVESGGKGHFVYRVEIDDGFVVKEGD